MGLSSSLEARGSDLIVDGAESEITIMSGMSTNELPISAYLKNLGSKLGKKGEPGGHSSGNKHSITDNTVNKIHKEKPNTIANNIKVAQAQYGKRKSNSKSLNDQRDKTAESPITDKVNKDIENNRISDISKATQRQITEPAKENKNSLSNLKIVTQQTIDIPPTLQNIESSIQNSVPEADVRDNVAEQSSSFQNTTVSPTNLQKMINSYEYIDPNSKITTSLKLVSPHISIPKRNQTLNIETKFNGNIPQSFSPNALSNQTLKESSSNLTVKRSSKLEMSKTNLVSIAPNPRLEIISCILSSYDKEFVTCDKCKQNMNQIKELMQNPQKPYVYKGRELRYQKSKAFPKLLDELKETIATRNTNCLNESSNSLNEDDSFPCACPECCIQKNIDEENLGSVQDRLNKLLAPEPDQNKKLLKEQLDRKLPKIKKMNDKNYKSNGNVIYDPPYKYPRKNRRSEPPLPKIDFPCEMYSRRNMFFSRDFCPKNKKFTWVMNVDKTWRKVFCE